jgi:hypothetical protein
LWRNRQTEAYLILRSKPTNCHGDFEVKPLETVANDFEAKQVRTVTTGFETKPAKTV